MLKVFKLKYMTVVTKLKTKTTLGKFGASEALFLVYLRKDHLSPKI